MCAIQQVPSVTRDSWCFEKREIPTVSEFDGVARFHETIPTVKSVSSYEIYKNFGFSIKITVLLLLRKN